MNEMALGRATGERVFRVGVWPATLLPREGMTVSAEQWLAVGRQPASGEGGWSGCPTRILALTCARSRVHVVEHDHRGD